MKKQHNKIFNFILMLCLIISVVAFTGCGKKADVDDTNVSATGKIDTEEDASLTETEEIKETGTESNGDSESESTTGNSTGSPEGNNTGSTGDSNAGSTGESSTGSTGESSTGSTGGSNTGSTGDSNTGSTGGSNTGSTGESSTGSTGDSNTGSTGDSNTGSTGGSNTGSTGDSNTGSTGDSNTDSTGDSNTDSPTGNNTEPGADTEPDVSAFQTGTYRGGHKVQAMGSELPYTYTMQFHDDGTYSYQVSFVVGGETYSEEETGTYSVNGNSISFTSSDGTTMSGSYSDHVVTVTRMVSSFASEEAEITLRQ